MDFNKVTRLYHTIKYLKSIQIYYQLKYKVIKPHRTIKTNRGTLADLRILSFPNKQESFSYEDGKWNFNFLNITQGFSSGNMNWDYSCHGMLWAYNLNYFDFLHQGTMTKDVGLNLLNKYYGASENNTIILHPYPTSLRIINISKFISKWHIDEEWLYSELVSDLEFLNRRLEYHLLANHLLENAFAIYIGGIITGKKDFIIRGKKLLEKQLHEQILEDGMHFERSPMYHLIILERLLDSLNFASVINDDLLPVLKNYAIAMISLARNWEYLERIPMMQDSTSSIALSVSEVLRYAETLLGTESITKIKEFGSSGYKKIDCGVFCLIANFASLGPNYQPGHSHADELNFELFYKYTPIIVDSGVSTYEKNARRHLERSTKSHNCLTVNDYNSSDIWSGFRVGKRAVVKLEKSKSFIRASHNGYKGLNISRTIFCEDLSLVIVDQVESINNTEKRIIYGRLHIHPSFSVNIKKDGEVNVGNILSLEFSSPANEFCEIKLDEYEYALGYNRLKKAKVIVYSCQNQTKIKIRAAS